MCMLCLLPCLSLPALPRRDQRTHDSEARIISKVGNTTTSQNRTQSHFYNDSYTSATDWTPNYIAEIGKLLKGVNKTGLRSGKGYAGGKISRTKI